MKIAAMLFKCASFLYEGFLAIPFIGGLFIFANAWMPLLYAFILHLITFILCKQTKLPIAGNVVGMVSSILGLIPFIGWLMHCITAIILLVEPVSTMNRRSVY